MVAIRALGCCALLASGLSLAACVGGGAGITQGAQPQRAVWHCTKDARLTIRRTGGGLDVADSRGFSVTLPPDPPGQRERYARTGYALVFAGRTASWFAAGQSPADCRR